MALIDDGGSTAETHVEEDENYFISMTDMMVGILFIFIIMLMIFALNFQQHTDLSVEQIKQLKAVTQQAELTATKLELLQGQIAEQLREVDKPNQVRAALLEEIRKRLAEQGLNVQIDTANGVLRLTEDAVRFPLRSADLTDTASANVAKIATVLAAVLPNYACAGRHGAACDRDAVVPSVETVFIEGHTDKQGLDTSNWTLSTARAVTTYQALVQDEPTLKSMTNRQAEPIISVSGYSSTRPVVDQPTQTAYAANRRIDLRFVMEVDGNKHLADMLDLTHQMQLQLQQLHSAIDRANAK